MESSLLFRSVCLSARPTQAPPYLTALYVLHINSLSFVCGHDVVLTWHNKGLITIGLSIIVTFPFLYCCNKRQGSSVGVVTILRGEQQGNVGSTPGRSKRYSLFHSVQTCSGAQTGFLSDAQPGVLHVGVKRPERVDVHSPSCSVEVKITWSYVFTPPCIFMASLLINDVQEQLYVLSLEYEIENV